MEPTDEQIKEFWEYWGFFKEESPDPDIKWLYRAPDSMYISFKGYPPINLNNLFKWAVPKVFRLGYNHLECRIDSRRDGDGYMWIISKYDKQVSIRSDYLIDPALALFWAIWKVIKEEHGS